MSERSIAAMTLLELNSLVSDCLTQTFTSIYWVQAELSDVRINNNGHCYLELIQQDEKRHVQIAKARAIIWSRTMAMIQPYFESTTGQSFTSGLKVLVGVEVQFHELYGYSLVIVDIDPTYTVGESVRRRKEIVALLKEDGILTLNQELTLPLLPQKIAVISSPTAAGYGDFMNQLNDNAKGFVFYTRLFPAIMQGEQVEKSIIEALTAIYNDEIVWDAVVIIRGGGASSDLTGFDTYDLAAHCAQFPLPIITGIGHERDDTVLDLIAYQRVKTPTAAAEFLIQQLTVIANRFETLTNQLVQLTQQVLLQEKHRFSLWSQQLKTNYQQRKWNELHRLNQLEDQLPNRINNRLETQKKALEYQQERLKTYFEMLLFKAKGKLEMIEHRVNAMSPELLLKRGYSITLKDGKAVTDATTLKEGDVIITRLANGEVESKVSIKK
jgi:exodeoxyribonuclease VII large subunit